MAYDSIRVRTVLVGGDTTFNPFYFGETWEWNGSAWTQRTALGPLARHWNAMAYDSARGVTVLFGGFNDYFYLHLGDTWEWDGTTWRNPSNSGPTPRAGHAMAYDSARGVTVLFGGSPGGGETWEWNGIAWTQRVVGGPSPRWWHAMAYDSARGVTVLFGGSTNSGSNSETWEWNGTVWTQRMGSGPSPRQGHAMAYDTNRGVVVLFGGNTGGSPIGDIDNGETWEWSGTAWTQRSAPGPSPRFAQSMAYDAAHGVTVLFGGETAGNSNGETWWLGSCSGPSLTAEPLEHAACSMGSVPVVLTAMGFTAFSYKWQVQTTPGTWQTLGNDPSPLPCGGSAYATPPNSPNVTVGIRPCAGNPTLPQYFQLRCVVASTCGSVVSNEAAYTICPADFSCSGTLEVADIFAFLNAWFAGLPSGDFNGVSGLTIADIFNFLDAWFAGCP